MKKLLLVVLVASVATGAQAQGSESFVVQQAKGAGVKKCLSTVRNVADSILGGRPHSVHCEWATSNPDAGIFSCEVEAWSANPAEAKYSTYASLAVTPTAGGQCAADYTTINQYAENCRTVRQRSTTMDLETKKQNLIRLRRTGGNVSNYLMEQSGRCTLVKHEMFIDELK